MKRLPQLVAILLVALIIPSTTHAVLVSVDIGSASVNFSSPAFDGTATFPSASFDIDITGSAILGTRSISGSFSGQEGVSIGGTDAHLINRSISVNGIDVPLSPTLTLHDDSFCDFNVFPPCTLLDLLADWNLVSGFFSIPGAGLVEVRVFGLRTTIAEGAVNVLNGSLEERISLRVLPVPEPSSAWLLIGGGFTLWSFRKLRAG